MTTHIYNLEDCFACLGADNPFTSDGNLSDEGNRAFNTLRELLSFMQENNVITGFDEDKLDKLVSEPAY